MKRLQSTFPQALRWVAAAGLLLGLTHAVIAAPPPVSPAVLQPGPNYTVNSADDPGDADCQDSSCSLRAAITAANADGVTSAIDFDLPAPASITLASALPAITGVLTISGPGAENLAISGDQLYRVLEVSSGAELGLSQVTIQDGHTDLSGGGVYNNHGTLTIDESTITANYVIHGGAGVANDHGTLTITNSLISANLAGSGDGGGVYNDGGTATITNSTFFDNDGFHDGGITNHGLMTISNSLFDSNTARIGGAIDNASDGTLTVAGSTFRDNVAPFNGGAIQNTGALLVVNSTFYKNGSTSGADISNQGPTVYVTNSTFSDAISPSLNSISGNAVLRNNLLAAESGIANCAPGAGTLSADSYNLATDSTCDSATLTTSGDLHLGPLLNYGGDTPTRALLPGSAALDAGDDAVCTAAVGAPDYGAGGIDQRGVTRPQGTHCDVGAFELGETEVLPLTFLYLPLIDD